MNNVNNESSFFNDTSNKIVSVLEDMKDYFPENITSDKSYITTDLQNNIITALYVAIVNIVDYYFRAVIVEIIKNKYPAQENYDIILRILKLDNNKTLIGEKLKDSFAIKHIKLFINTDVAFDTSVIDNFIQYRNKIVHKEDNFSIQKKLSDVVCESKSLLLSLKKIDNQIYINLT